jgi:hypothetical protein
MKKLHCQLCQLAGIVIWAKLHWLQSGKKFGSPEVFASVARCDKLPARLSLARRSAATARRAARPEREAHQGTSMPI